ncbi:MAG: lipopolysaccharide heptosyltransferase II [Candidatus Omnitrophica bacterium]|nr:lipopolysaccharide heptosyltransferase II [Candidatus Omnitrophota bacterium]
MNILQILPKLDVGGVETGTVDLSKELIKRGHKVIVVSGGGKLVKNLIEINVKHIELPVHKKSLFTILDSIKKLEAIIKDERVDIVHSRSRIPNIIAFFAARHTGAKFITTAHGYYSNHFISRVTGWAKFVIVASSVIGRHMIEDFKVPYERIKLIPRGVDLDKFKFNMPTASSKSEYKIGVVGRITLIKGHGFFLQAIARVVRLFPKVKILIVGDAPKDKPGYIENLKSLAKQLQIEKYVEFLGAQYDIPKIMSGLDLLVLPSIGREAFGRVIIEAGASGVPVIATRIGGAMEIIEDGHTGVLVKPGDILEMVNSIIRVLKDRELSKNIAIEARKKIEREYSLVKMTEDTVKVYEEACRKKNILVIKFGAIGDVMLIVPSLRILKNHFPWAHISVLIGAEAKHILKNCPYIDELILYDKKGRDRGLKGLLKTSAILRRKNFDKAIDFQNNRTSHLISWLGAIPERFGYDNRKWSFFINKSIKYLDIKATPLDEQFRLLKSMKINTMGASTYLEIWPSRDDFSYIDALLKNAWVSDSQILAGINIGSSRRWETKRWPLKNFARLSDMLAEKDIRVVLIGSNDAADLARDFIKVSSTKPVNAIGKTSVTQLAALIKRCKVFITGDSAPMHVASSMGVDFIALFGPTDPARHFEPNEKGVVIRKDLKCSPCYKTKCKHTKCMKSISVEEVYRLAMKRIEDRKNDVK